LRATARWFTHLKRQRRALRITAGNPQDVCFPLAYELATHHGPPGPDADAIAQDILRDRHGDAEPAGVQQLADYLAEPAVVTELTGRLHRGWQAALTAGAGWAAHSPAAIEALRACVEALGAGHADSAWRMLRDSRAGQVLGEALRYPGGADVLHEAIRTVVPAAATTGLPVALGLQRGAMTAMPSLTDDPAESPVLERSVRRRVHSTLRRQGLDDRQPVATVVDDEVARVTEGFGLFTPALAACFAIGVLLAPALRPLGEPSQEVLPEFARRLTAQLAREGYVLHARRNLAGSQPLTIGASGDLDHVLRELLEFHRPFLHRLWTRLHGFDVRGERLEHAQDMRDLITGVVRSTSLDLRTKVRRALDAQLASAELETAS
jgi:hypothetical protein